MINKVLVTGSAGFIGFHLSQHLLSKGYSVLGIDALTEYYDINLKLNRLKLLEKNSNFTHKNIRIEESRDVSEIFKSFLPNFVVHLAAQAGVRYSIDHPDEYIKTNILGTFTILEVCRKLNIQHLLMASTSSIYGANKDLPFKELQKTETPMSFYAATKKSNELMAHSYSHVFNLPITILRFFTVYGPWGRPDMALFKFVKAITNNEEIEIYNYGNMKRDFTYVSDLVFSIEKLLNCIPLDISKRNPNSTIKFDSLSEVAPYRHINIGNSKPIELMSYIHALENALGLEAKKSYKPIQLGDVPETWADTRLLKELIGYTPSTSVEIGVKNFVEWYLSYINK